jgi:hypothetical protein
MLNQWPRQTEGQIKSSNPGARVIQKRFKGLETRRCYNLIQKIVGATAVADRNRDGLTLTRRRAKVYAVNTADS